MSTHVTDEALTAQPVETPCTPPAAAFLHGFGFRFSVDVTEMAKLGPDKSPHSQASFFE
jgi:hypothetical protein